MITPKRIKNADSPENTFIRAKQISQAKAERSVSGNIKEIDIRSPEKEINSSINIQNQNIRQSSNENTRNNLTSYSQPISYDLSN